jgi:hypothetical protein
MSLERVETPVQVVMLKLFVVEALSNNRVS